MNCGIECIKYLLFIFNFLFALGGLAILACGIIIKTQAEQLYAFDPEVAKLGFPSTTLIVIGAIIFIITFFGCCGAIRESHCMTTTYGVLLLTLLVVQVAVAAYIFISLDGKDVESEINKGLQKYIQDYAHDDIHKNTINTMQASLQCCGFAGPADYENIGDGKIPYSCCGKQENQNCSKEETRVPGCKDKVYPLIHKHSQTLAYLALGIAGIELIGIIFSFCLANSILNVERRGYKV